MCEKGQCYMGGSTSENFFFSAPLRRVYGHSFIHFHAFVLFFYTRTTGENEMSINSMPDFGH